MYLYVCKLTNSENVTVNIYTLHNSRIISMTYFEKMYIVYI